MFLLVGLNKLLHGEHMFCGMFCSCLVKRMSAYSTRDALEHLEEVRVALTALLFPPLRSCR